MGSRDDDEARLEYVQEEIEEQFFESRQDDLAETDKAWDAIHRPRLLEANEKRHSILFTVDQ